MPVMGMESSQAINPLASTSSCLFGDKTVYPLERNQMKERRIGIFDEILINELLRASVVAGESPASDLQMLAERDSTHNKE